MPEYQMSEQERQTIYGIMVPKPGEKPRQLTDGEVRAEFLKRVVGSVRYWQTVKPETAPNPQPPLSMEDRVSGIAFSLLVMLDGNQVGFPAVSLVPQPHPDDKEFNKGEGMHWYPCPREPRHDFGGALHEEFHGYLRGTK